MTDEEKKEVAEIVSTAIAQVMSEIETSNNKTSSANENEVERLRKELKESQKGNRVLLEQLGKTKTVEETLYEAMGGKLDK